MFMPTDENQARLSSEDSRVVALWFRGLLIFYGSMALIALLLASALRDGGKEMQATAGASVGIHAVSVAVRP